MTSFLLNPITIMGTCTCTTYDTTQTFFSTLTRTRILGFSQAPATRALCEHVGGRLMWMLRLPYYVFWIAAAPYAWLTRMLMKALGELESSAARL